MLYIQKTNVTPEIQFDSNKGILTICGRSSPDYSQAFFEPLMKALETLDQNIGSFQANFKMTMFNTSSAKCIYDILKKIKAMSSHGTELEVNWYYEDSDEDMMECGEDFSDLLSMDFRYIESDSFDSKHTKW